MNKTRLKKLRIILYLLAASASLACVICLCILPGRPSWPEAQTLSDAMTSARAVTIEEYSPAGLAGSLELIHKRIAASLDQQTALRSATGGWLAKVPDYDVLCFSPHHRVKIVRADGSTFNFEVCFQCRNFKMGESGVTTLPSQWIEPLRKFFTSAGMAPLEDYSSLDKQHPEYSTWEKQQDLNFRSTEDSDAEKTLK